MATAILLSVGAADALIPLMIIVILLVAAAGATRGYSIFNLFGIATLAGIGVGRGSVQGRSALGRYFLVSADTKPPRGLARRVQARIQGRKDRKTQLAKDLAAKRPKTTLEGSVVGAATAGKASKEKGKVRMAVSTAAAKALGNQNSGRRKFVRTLGTIAFPPAAMAAALARKNKARRGEGKSSLSLNRGENRNAQGWRKYSPVRLNERDVTKRKTSLKSSIDTLDDQQKRADAIMMRRDILAGKNTDGRRVRSVEDEVRERERQGGRMTLKEARQRRRGMRMVQPESEDPGIRRRQRILKQVSPQGSRRYQEMSDVRSGKLGTLQLTKEQVDAGMKPGDASAPGSVRGRLNTQVDAIIAAETAREQARSKINAAKERFNTGEITKTEYDAQRTAHEKAASDATKSLRDATHEYNATYKQWQRDSGKGARSNKWYIPGEASKSPQGTIIRQVRDIAIGAGAAGYRGARGRGEYRPTRPGPGQQETDAQKARREAAMELGMHRAMMSAAGFDRQSTKGREKRRGKKESQENPPAGDDNASS